jgi:hypothetical protein
MDYPVYRTKWHQQRRSGMLKYALFSIVDEIQSCRHRLMLSTLMVCCTCCGVDSNVNGLAARSDFAEVLPPQTGLQSPSDKAGKQSSLDLLVSLATDEVHSDSAFLGRTRFELDEQDHTFRFDLSPVPRRAVLSETDPFSVVLEALIRVEALRRDFQTTVPNEQFWVKPLDSVQAVARQCSESIDRASSNAESEKTQKACSINIEEQLKSLDASVRIYAAAHKLTPKATSQERDPAIGYRVQVTIDPPRARVKIMTALEYKKSLAFKTPLEDRWNDLLDGDNEMIGRYHYLAEWPAELNGPEEGNFEIRKPTKLTFRPKEK